MKGPPPPPLVRPPHQRRRLLEPMLTPIIDQMSRRYGKCWASEAGLRREIHRRTGLCGGEPYVCGERSIGRVVKRLVLRGQWGAERVKPNRLMVTGEKTLIGTTHTWIVSRYEQRKARRRAAEEKRQRLRAEGKERARAERERLDVEQREREAMAPPRRARVSSEALMQAPPKLSDLLKPPSAPAPSTFEEASERRRREVARQLAELAKLDLDDKPPDE